MTKNTTHIRVVTLTFLIFTLVMSTAYATVFTSAQSGFFSVGSTWVGGNAPGPGDDIVVSAGHTVTLDNTTVRVRNITIDAGATLDNGIYPLTIYSTTPGANPVYSNNGNHVGTGNLVLYDGGATTFTGTGTTACTVVIESYGILINNACSLVINGNIQHAVPGNNGMDGKVLISAMQTSGMLTVNGSVITDDNYMVGIEMGTGTTLEISGDLSLPGGLGSGAGSTLTVQEGGTLTVGGNLVLGPYSGYCQNFGTITIGGDLTGAFDTYFIQEVNSTVRFGGDVFADGSGLFFAVESPLLGSAVPNTVEYNGTADQAIVVPTDMAYSNLVISNTGGVVASASDVTVTGDLTVKPGAWFTMNDGTTLSVTGTFLVESDETGTGSFIGSSSVNGTIQRYMEGHNGNTNAGWHFLSAPVAAQAISTFHTPGSGDDFYKWDEPSATWVNRTAAGGILNPEFETDFVTGKGYLVAYVTTTTAQFEGTLHAADVQVNNLTSSADTSYAGWHLIGNPYASALLWNDGNWSLNNVDANCQIWNETNASYSVISPEGVIPAMNGVMVHAAADNASLTIPAVSRTHNAVAWYKSPFITGDQITLMVHDYAGNTAQPSIIRFDAEATVGYDNQYDSYFLAGYAPLFYSLSEDEAYALNSLPLSASEKPVPLGFIKNDGSAFVMELTENTANHTVYLKDEKTGLTHCLNQGSYSFTSEEGDEENRFSLLFGTVGIPQAPEASKPTVWVVNNILYSSGDMNGTVALYDLTGREVKRMQKISPEGKALDLPAGVYVVRIQGAAGVASAKVLVQ